MASGNLDNFVYVQDDGAYINTDRNGSQYQWEFSTTGSLILILLFACTCVEGTGDFGFEMLAFMLASSILV